MSRFTSISRRMLALSLGLTLSGCAVVSVGGAVVGAAISVTGAVVSTGVELTGKAIGAGIDALSSDDAPDSSGIVIKHTERPASAPAPAASSSPVAPGGGVAPRPLPPASGPAG